MNGFGSYFETEAVKGALPIGRNSPQRVPFGLYAEQLSGSAFTAPRFENRHSWLYRIRPSASHGPFRPYDDSGLMRSAPFEEAIPSPNRLRWNRLLLPDRPLDFVEGLTTYCGNGDVSRGEGVAVHLYAATQSMDRRVFFNADGELLIVPQLGRLELRTELGILTIEPQQIGIIPRGVRFSMLLPDGTARGYVCENYGAPFRLPELGPIGANGLANPRDFVFPDAWFEDRDEPFQLVQKFQGRLWITDLDHSPLDVVAWHGNLAPYAYDLRRFNAMNTVSFDHPDPSIFTVLTSPSESPGIANCDFVIFPPRWTVAEDTFRPPWFHRNVMSEFMGLIVGIYDAKAAGFDPGGASLHNQMSAHGPDAATYHAASRSELAPHRIEATTAFMFESRWVLRPTLWATATPLLQLNYDTVWNGLPKAELPRRRISTIDDKFARAGLITEV